MPGPRAVVRTGLETEGRQVEDDRVPLGIELDVLEIDEEALGLVVMHEGR